MTELVVSAVLGFALVGFLHTVDLLVEVLRRVLGGD